MLHQSPKGVLRKNISLFGSNEYWGYTIQRSSMTPLSKNLVFNYQIKIKIIYPFHLDVFMLAFK
jgi:hypothetical protein